MNTRKLFLAGFGGQGVLLIGQIISYAAMYEEKYVTFLPSYGPEMRGGTANCTVIVSDSPIACPLADSVTDLVVMNLPSLLKFESTVEAGGNIFLNESLIHKSPERSDVNVFRVDAAGLAEKIGSGKSSNIVMLGAIIKKTGVVRNETVEKVLAEKIFTGAKAGLLARNMPALTAWAE